MALANGYSHSPSAAAASSTQNTPGGMAKDEDESMDHASGSQSHADSEVDELEDDENASEAGSDVESEEDERDVLKPLHSQSLSGPDVELDALPSPLPPRPELTRLPPSPLEHLVHSLSISRDSSLSRDCATPPLRSIVEVRLSPHSTLRHDHVKHLVSSFINANVAYAKIDGQEIEDWQGVPLLKANCESVKAAECGQSHHTSSSGRGRDRLSSARSAFLCPRPNPRRAQD